MKQFLTLLFLSFLAISSEVLSQGTERKPHICGSPLKIHNEFLIEESGDGKPTGVQKSLPVNPRAYTQSIHNAIAKWDGGSVYRYEIGTGTSGAASSDINNGSLLRVDEVNTQGHSYPELQASAIAQGTIFTIGQLFYINLYYLSSSTSPSISFPLTFLWEDLGNASNEVTIDVATNYGVGGASPFTATQAAKILDFYTKVNPIVKSIYGPPSRNHTGTVVNDGFAVDKNIYYNGPNQISSSYTVDANGDLDQPRLMIHELIHCYRDNVGLSTDGTWHYDPELSGFEEGFAEAVANVVMGVFVGMYPNYFHSSSRQNKYWGTEFHFDYEYDFQNHKQVTSEDFWSSDIATGSAELRYGLSSAALQKMYHEDPNVFKNFNAELYARMNADHSLIMSRALVVDIFNTIKPEMERTPMVDWINDQRVFDCVIDQRKKIFMLSYTALSWNSHQYDNRIYLLETHENGLEWKWDSNSTLPNTLEVPNYPQPLYSWTHQLNNVPGLFSITRDWNNVKKITDLAMKNDGHWVNENPADPAKFGIPILGPYQGPNPYTIGSTFTRDHEQDNCTAVPGCGKRAWAICSQDFYTSTSDAVSMWPKIVSQGGTVKDQRTILNLNESGLFRYEMQFNDPNGPAVKDTFFRLHGDDFIDIDGIIGGIYNPSANLVDGKIYIEHNDLVAEPAMIISNNSFKAARTWASIPVTDVKRQAGRSDTRMSTPGKVHAVYTSADCAQKKIDFRTIGYGDGLYGTQAFLFNTAEMDDILFVESNDTSVCEGDNFTLSVTNNFPDIFKNDSRVTYAWKDPSSTIISTDTTFNFSNATTLDAGVYTLDIGFFGCPVMQKSVTITIGNPPVVDFGLPDTINVCFSDQIDFTANAIAGGVYTWTNPAGVVFSSLQNPTVLGSNFSSAGYYIVSVAAAGCGGAPLNAIDSVYVNITASASINLTDQMSISECEGSTVNLLSDFISGATYSWTGPNNFTSSLQSPSILSAQLINSGSYRVIVSIPGCNNSIVSDTAYTFVEILSSTVAAVTVPTPTINICENGTLNLACTPNSGSSVVWSGPNGFSSSLQNPSISNATLAMAGTYTVLVSSLGCNGQTTTATASVNVTVQANPVVSAQVPTPNVSVCQGAVLNLFVSTVPGASYSWTNVSSGFNSNLQNPSIPNVTSFNSGTYQVTVTVLGCNNQPISDVAIVDVIVTPDPIVTVVTNSAVAVCPGDVINLSANSIVGASYLWDGPSGFSSTNEDPSFTAIGGVNSGIYTVTAIVPGCLANTFVTGTSTVVVNVSDLTGIETNITGVQLICENESLTLTAGSNNTISSYEWITPDGTISNNASLTVNNFNFLDTGVYYLTTNYGCVGLDLLDSISIGMQDEEICHPTASYYMPTAFSPNGDNINDVLYVYGKAIKNIDLVIYDRFGSIVFTSNKQSLGWDGTFNGEALNTAVFTYKLTISFTTSLSPVSMNGNVSLIR